MSGEMLLIICVIAVNYMIGWAISSITYEKHHPLYVALSTLFGLVGSIMYLIFVILSVLIYESYLFFSARFKYVFKR